MAIRSAVATLVVASCALAGTAASAQGMMRNRGDLDVTVHDVGAGTGRVYCALFNTHRGFPTQMDSAYRETSTSAQQGTATCRFTGVAPGTYAVSAFHDANGNGRLDRHVFGAPKEPVGSSNDARARMMGPRFDDAAFQYNGSASDISVRLMSR